MEPVMSVLEAQYAGRIKFIEVNVDEESGRRLAAEYRISGSPTYLFLYTDGFVVGQLVGRQTEADMQAALETLLAR
jgi:thioredoxin-like negative regulator of GroEL